MAADGVEFADTVEQCDAVQYGAGGDYHFFGWQFFEEGEEAGYGGGDSVPESCVESHASGERGKR